MNQNVDKAVQEAIAKRKKQIEEMEAELRLPLTKNRRRDLMAMLRHSRFLLTLNK